MRSSTAKRGRPLKRGRTLAQLRATKQSAPDPDTARIVGKVYELMSTKQITLAELAERSEINASTLYQYLHPFRNGFGPLRISVIRSLAKGCGASLQDVLSCLRP